MKNKRLKIGTRGSTLALWQAEEVASRLDTETELVIIKTSGDKFQNIPLQGQTETGFFTKEIENQLLSERIDIAVHSLKDLPTRIHPELTLGAYLPRSGVNDLILVHPEWHDPALLIPVKDRCRVGATSLRRQALLRLYGPQAEPVILRGNVPTRIKKCQEQEYGAIILAQAGLERLGLDPSPLLVFRLNPEIWLPAPGQGVIAVQIRNDNTHALNHVVKLDHTLTRNAVTIERQLMANFEGGCHVAFGSYAQWTGEEWLTHIGLDQPGNGWVQTEVCKKSIERLLRISPGSLTDFHPLKVESKKKLCRKIRL